MECPLPGKPGICNVKIYLITGKQANGAQHSGKPNYRLTVQTDYVCVPFLF